MGLFSGFGSITFNMEYEQIKNNMASIDAWESEEYEKCERCNYWLSANQINNKNGFGGCRYYEIKVLSNYVCENYTKN